MFGLGLTFFGVLRTSLGLLRSFLCVLFALLPSRFHGAYLVLPTLIHRHHEIGEGVCALDLRHVELRSPLEIGLPLGMWASSLVDSHTDSPTPPDSDSVAAVRAGQ